MFIVIQLRTTAVRRLESIGNHVVRTAFAQQRKSSRRSNTDLSQQNRVALSALVIKWTRTLEQRLVTDRLHDVPAGVLHNPHLDCLLIRHR